MLSLHGAGRPKDARVNADVSLEIAKSKRDMSGSQKCDGPPASLSWHVMLTESVQTKAQRDVCPRASGTELGLHGRSRRYVKLFKPAFRPEFTEKSFNVFGS